MSATFILLVALTFTGDKMTNSVMIPAPSIESCLMQGRVLYSDPTGKTGKSGIQADLEKAMRGANPLGVKIADVRTEWFCVNSDAAFEYKLVVNVEYPSGKRDSYDEPIPYGQHTCEIAARADRMNVVETARRNRYAPPKTSYACRWDTDGTVTRVLPNGDHVSSEEVAD